MSALIGKVVSVKNHEGEYTISEYNPETGLMFVVNDNGEGFSVHISNCKIVKK
jgi:hypothetical protein